MSKTRWEFVCLLCVFSAAAYGKDAVEAAVQAPFTGSSVLPAGKVTLPKQCEAPCGVPAPKLARLNVAGSLATVHITIGEYLPSQLPADGTFDFSASAATAGSGCPGTLNSMATPNPALLAVPYSIQ